MSFFTCFVGPFGVGKTTISKYIFDSNPQEYSPVFEDLSTNLFLEAVWQGKDPKFFEMQANFIADICYDLVKIDDALNLSTSIVLYDRSLLEAAVIYPKFQKYLGLLSPSQEKVLNDLYGSVKPVVPAPDLFFYCKADPQTIFDRIYSRGRKHESKVSLEDVKRLCQVYEEVMGYEDIPCFEINTEQTLDEIKLDVERIIRKVF